MKKVATIICDQFGRTASVPRALHGTDSFSCTSVLEDFLVRHGVDMDELYAEDATRLVENALETAFFKKNKVTHVVCPETFGDEQEHTLEEYLDQE